ncbi:hypothetical protein AB0L96_40695 [Streptomyces sp. NPDC052115]|uniref:hypothetical protein n=1 Tax=Streptomyces sp. NPDC052115 TaxID=3155794 RepID=UPI003445E04B
MRFVRAAAGRRALQVVLVLGGLMVLGLLLGGRAQAADGPVGGADAVSAGQARPLKSAAEPVADPVAESTAEPIAPSAADSTAEPVTRTVRHAADAVTEPVAEPVARPAVRPAVRPVVRPNVRPLVRPVGEVVDGVAGTLPEASDPSKLLPGHGTPPGSGDGAGRGSGAEPAPAHEGAQPPGKAGERADSASGRDRSAERRPVGPRADSAYMSAIRWADGASVRDRDAHGGVVAGEYGTGRPSLPSPVPPGGSVVNATAGDGGSSRPGDLHAAAFGGRTPVRHLVGPGFSPDHALLRDRHRDIPEFPG